LYYEYDICYTVTQYKPHCEGVIISLHYRICVMIKEAARGRVKLRNGSDDGFFRGVDR
jgi:hypothetical protein